MLLLRDGLIGWRWFIVLCERETDLVGGFCLVWRKFFPYFIRHHPYYATRSRERGARKKREHVDGFFPLLAHELWRTLLQHYLSTYLHTYMQALAGLYVAVVYGWLNARGKARERRGKGRGKEKGEAFSNPSSSLLLLYSTLLYTTQHNTKKNGEEAIYLWIDRDR